METYYITIEIVCQIDITVTISIAVATGCNFPHGEVGKKSHHIKVYNRLSIS